jgi:hypothetical protein
MKFTVKFVGLGEKKGKQKEVQRFNHEQKHQLKLFNSIKIAYKQLESFLPLIMKTKPIHQFIKLLLLEID